MKVATLKDGSRDGRLVVVSDDLTKQHNCEEQTLQRVLDTSQIHPNTEEQPFDPAACLSPLPRAFQFLDGSAYVNHVELVRKARGAAMPDSFWTDPLMYQAGSDEFLAPNDPIKADRAWGIDFEAEIAVITGNVPLGSASELAAEKIEYVMLLNDVSLRNLISAELGKGFGFLQSKPASACSPVAVTPDSLSGWDGAKLHGILRVDLNGTSFGRTEAGIDMTFDFPALIAHATRTRSLGAGTIVGSGTVSNRGKNGPGLPISEGGAGYSCIAEQRMVETMLHGAPRTRFLQSGDTVKIWMEDADGQSIFGAIEQTVQSL